MVVVAVLVLVNSCHIGNKTKACELDGINTIGWSLEIVANPNMVVTHSSADNYSHPHYLRYDSNTGKINYEGYESNVKYILKNRMTFICY